MVFYLVPGEGLVQGRNWPAQTASSPLLNSFLLVLDGHLRERTDSALSWRGRGRVWELSPRSTGKLLPSLQGAATNWREAVNQALNSSRGLGSQQPRVSLGQPHLPHHCSAAHILLPRTGVRWSRGASW